MIVARHQPSSVAPVHTLALPSNLLSLAIGPAGIAVGTTDGRMMTLDPQTGETRFDARASSVRPVGEDEPYSLLVPTVHRLLLEPAAVRAIALTDRYVVAAIADHLELWDRATGRLVVAHPPHRPLLTWVAVDPVRGRVATCDLRSRGVRVADLETGEGQWGPGNVLLVTPDVPWSAAARRLVDALDAYDRFSLRDRPEPLPVEPFVDPVRAVWAGGSFETATMADWGVRKGGFTRAEADEGNGLVQAVVDAIRALDRKERAAVQPLFDAIVSGCEQRMWQTEPAWWGRAEWLADGRLVTEERIPPRVDEYGNPVEGAFDVTSRVRVWDLDRKKAVLTLEDAAIVTVLADGFVTVSGKQEIRVHPGAALSTGSPGAVRLHRSVLSHRGVRFRPDHTPVAVVGDEVWLLNEPNGSSGELCAFRSDALGDLADGIAFTGVALDPTGSLIAVTRGADVLRWEPATDRFVRLGESVDGTVGVQGTTVWAGVGNPTFWPPPPNLPAREAVTLVEGRFVLPHDNVWILDLATGTSRETKLETDFGRVAAVDPSGKVGLVELEPGSQNPSCQPVDLTTGKNLGKPMRANHGPVRFGSDGTLVQLAKRRGAAMPELVIHDLKTGKRTSAPVQQPDGIPGEFGWPEQHPMPDGRVLVVWPYLGQVDLWSSESFTPVRPPEAIRPAHLARLREIADGWSFPVHPDAVYQGYGVIPARLSRVVFLSGNRAAWVVDDDETSVVEVWTFDPPSRVERIDAGPAGKAVLAAAGDHLLIGTGAGELVLHRLTG